MLIAVPGGNDGPGGVLVCSENFIVYKNHGHADKRCALPRRRDLPTEHGLLLVSSAVHRQRDLFFILVQSEFGDLYKVTLGYEEDQVSEVKVRYLDSVPVCSALCILKSGFLFCAAEFGNHGFYQFQGVGDDEDSPLCTSAAFDAGDETVVELEPRPLRNLLQVDDIDSLCPIMDCKAVGNLGEAGGSPSLVSICGKSARSTLRVLSHGLAVSEMAVSELPGNPNAVWTVKKRRGDEHDAYIVVSFVNATLVLSIGETVEEVTDSGLKADTPTLHTALLGEDAIVQARTRTHPRPTSAHLGALSPPRAPRAVTTSLRTNLLSEGPHSPRMSNRGLSEHWRAHTCSASPPNSLPSPTSPTSPTSTPLRPAQVYPNGIRHIRAGGQLNEWKAPRGREVTKATANARQVVIALAGGEVIYFELDAQGALAEMDKKDTGHDISCLEIGAVPAGRQRARFLAVGGWDNTIRVFSLDPDDCMSVLAVLALPAQAETAALLSMPLGTGGRGAETFFLTIGLNNGVLLRAKLDPRNGQLSDTRTRFLGTKPAKLFRLPIGGIDGVLCLSSRPWAAYCWQQQLTLSPVSYQHLEHGCSFASEHCPEGLVAVAGNTLRILSLDKLGDAFNAESLPLRYTPRKIAHHSASGHVVVVESDHNAYNEDEKAQLYEAAGIPPPLPAGSEVPDEDEAEEGVLMESVVGVPRGGMGKWASCVRLVDPATKATLSLLELPDNEAALSVAIVPFRERAGESIVIVGTAKDMTLHPRTCAAGFIHAYKFTNNNTTLELLHKTQVEDVPYALCAFSGRLLAGVGKSLRIYELGQKKMLRKCQLLGLPTMAQSIHVVSATRIVVGDLAESFHWVKYKRAENALVLFADDPAPRWLTASCVVDVNTLAGADKFGNVFLLRLPQEVSDDVDDAQLLTSGEGIVNGAPSKADAIVQFHVGDTITSLQKVVLGPGCAEVILYTTLQGGIGALLPFSSKEDLELLQALEMHLRQEAPPLCGRDQLFFRSAFFPIKGVVDGDFCAYFNRLPPDEQRTIASDLDRTPAEIAKKLEELASRIL